MWFSGRWTPQEIQDEKDLLKGGLGANAANSSPSGELAVIVQAFPEGEDPSLPALYYKERQIEGGDIQAQATTGVALLTKGIPVE